MSSDSPRMGRGLGALFGNAAASAAPPAQTTDTDTTASLADSVAPSHTLMVAIDAIEPNPRQPRQQLPAASLDSLARSLREHGVIQPLIVVLRPGAGNEQGPRYQLIAGHRRWEAAKLAGIKTVPVVVKHATPQQMLEMALVENIQREDLNPIEMARAYQMLVEEYNLTQEEVARRVGYERATVTNTLKLLTLDEEVQKVLMQGLDGFTAGHAKALVGLEPEQQIKLMQQIIAQNMSVRAAEEAAKSLKEATIRLASDRRGGRYGSMEVQRLEEAFTRAIAFKVSIKRNAQGRGAVTIHFNSEDELNQLYEMLVAHTSGEEEF